MAERLQAQEQEEFSDAEKATLFQQLLEKRRKHFAAKRAEEKRNKPPSQAQQRKIMCTYLKNMEGYKLKDLKNKGFDCIQEMFDRSFKRVNTFEDFRTDLVEGKEKRAGEELIQESSKKQKVDDDKETTERKQCMEIISDEEDVTIIAIHLAVKFQSIVDWKIHKEGKKIYYQIVRADGKSQMYRIFSQMLKKFNREDLEDLYKLVKAKYKSTRPVEDLDLSLWGDLKTMFEPHIEDVVWRNQQDYKVLDWNDEIEEEVYVCQNNHRFEDLNFPDRVYKVKKALYGLHQAPRAWFIEVKTASTPTETQKPLLKDEDGEEVDVHMYRSMIGSLMYLTSSRPDIMFAVSYTNSDIAGASLDRKSTTGDEAVHKELGDNLVRAATTASSLERRTGQW
ncbi:retrovirus-related pol polyprotein from transposon TNT 1-94 [Tanacetum coccineum]|uniref:Retrovirus-related pol polyprotein from transposon TNT 1-94 n=1 Tax=Tanacetum coccineum TaxID=301880 RepID=A0ABQ5IUQ3_9ASTR